MGLSTLNILETPQALQEGKAFNPYRHGVCAPMPLAVLSSTLLTPSAKLVYCHLRRRAGERGFCWPSRADIACATAITDRQVTRAIRQLEEVGLLRTTVRGSARGGRSNEYEFLWHRMLADEQTSSVENVSTRTDKIDSPPLTNCPLTPDNLSAQEGKEYLKRKGEEEERVREAPPHHPDPATDTAMEARAFIGAKVGPFLAAYPGEGSRKLTAEKALAAYLESGCGMPIGEWWDTVLDAAASYADWCAHHRRLPKDAPWWFEDGGHGKAWGRVGMPRVDASYGAVAEPEPPCVATVVEPESEPQPIRAAMPTAVKPRCRQCRGVGTVNKPMPSVSLDMPRDQLERLLSESIVACPSCCGATCRAVAA